MALPSTRTFTAKFTNPVTGEPAVGFALFDIVPGKWTDQNGNQILIGDRQRSFDEGSEGQISINLIITDETPGILPLQNRYWQMRVSIEGDWQTYLFTVPAGDGPIDLTDVELVESPDQTGWFVPVPGPPGNNGADGAPGVVQSVNGYTTPVINLDAGDVGAVPTSGGTIDGNLSVTGDTNVEGRFTVDDVAPLFNAIDMNAYLAGDMNGEFSAGHRGSGDIYPEHTLEGYRAALSDGAPAIEVSAQLTKDGTLVCMHDVSIERVTGMTGSVADYTYAQLLNAVRVKEQSFLGAGWRDCEIPTVTQVLDEIKGKCVIFLEPKTNDAVVPLQNLMDRLYPDGPETIVWKLYYQNSTEWAHSRGYKVWLYVDATTTQEQANPYDLGVDQPTFWGVPHTASDAVITAFVNRTNAYGDSPKKVMVWEVHRRWEQARFRTLGVKGFMCPGWSYIYNRTRMLNSKFQLRVQEPGFLGEANYDPNYAIQYDDGGRAYITQFPNQAALLGSATPDDASATWQVQFGMVWDTVPGANIHSGIAFARMDDSKYQFSSAANTVGGYHIAIRSSGLMQIYRHDPGVAAGVLLAQGNGTLPVAGHEMTFTVGITPSTITLTRTDTDDAPVVATDSTYRGEYQHLSVGSVTTSATKPYWTYLNVP